MGDYLDPKARWPEHGRPEVRSALREAAQKGWYLKPSNGHIFGTLSCSPYADSACVVAVYSTSGPADGSTTAKHIRQKLRKCTHQHSAVVEGEDVGIDAEEIGDRIKCLLDAIDGLTTRKEAESRAASAAGSNDPSTFDAAYGDFIRADNKSSIAWSGLGLPMDPWPPEIAIDELQVEIDRQLDMLEDAEPEAAEELRAMVEQHRP